MNKSEKEVTKDLQNNKSLLNQNPHAIKIQKEKILELGF